MACFFQWAAGPVLSATLGFDDLPPLLPSLDSSGIPRCVASTAFTTQLLVAMVTKTSSGSLDHSESGDRQAVTTGRFAADVHLIADIFHGVSLLRGMLSTRKHVSQLSTEYGPLPPNYHSLLKKSSFAPRVFLVESCECQHFAQCVIFSVSFVVNWKETARWCIWNFQFNLFNWEQSIFSLISVPL